jgi:hypothetical protein
VRCRRCRRALGGEGESKPGPALTKRLRALNRRFGKVRAKVDHVFRVLKCQFGYRKARYFGSWACRERTPASIQTPLGVCGNPSRRINCHLQLQIIK